MKYQSRDQSQDTIPLEATGTCPVSVSNTFDALVSLSPDSPTQMFRTSFSMWSLRMTLFSLVLGATAAVLVLSA